MIKIGEKFGNFLIKSEIGKGGMGTIFYAVDTMLNREVALKIIHPQFADNAQLMERFKIEAMTQARMNHSNIVMIYSFNKIDNDYVIVMEYIQGKSLKEILREQKRLGIRETIEYTREILEGLKYSHVRKVIHRDIKPANILISTDNHVKISDFGIAKVFGTEGVTKTGILVGTPWYTSPEQILGREIDFRADLYSLGVTFYEMVTGRVPFDSPSNSEFQIQKAHLETPPPRPSLFNSDISVEMERFILKSLQKRGEKRFQTAQEMLDALEELKSQKPVVLETTPGLKRRTIERPSQKKRFFTPVRTVGVSILILSAFLVIGFLSGLFKLPPSHKPVADQTKIFSRNGSVTPPSSGEKRVEEQKGQQETGSTFRNIMTADSQVKPSERGQNVPPGGEKNAGEPMTSTQESTKTSQGKTSGSQAGESAGQPATANVQKTEKKELEGEKHEPLKKNEAAETIVKKKETGQKQETAGAPTGEKLAPEKPALEVDATINRIRGKIMGGQMEDAEKEADDFLKVQTSSRMYKMAGLVKFILDKFGEADELWKKCLAGGEWIELQAFNSHENNVSFLGTLRLKKGMIIFNSETDPAHSFFLKTNEVSLIEKMKKAGFTLQRMSDGKKTEEILVLQETRNRDKKEKFLVDFIQKNIL